MLREELERLDFEFIYGIYYYIFMMKEGLAIPYRYSS